MDVLPLFSDVSIVVTVISDDMKVRTGCNPACLIVLFIAAMKKWERFVNKGKSEGKQRTAKGEQRF
jgi:hypothetical protein